MRSDKHKRSERRGPRHRRSLLRRHQGPWVIVKSIYTASPSSNRYRPLPPYRTTKTTPVVPSSSASIQSSSLPTTVPSILSGYAVLPQTSPSPRIAKPISLRAGYANEITGTAHERACSLHNPRSLWAVHNYLYAQRHQAICGRVPRPQWTSRLLRDPLPSSSIRQQSRVRRMGPLPRMYQILHDCEKTLCKRKRPAAVKPLNTRRLRRPSRPLLVF